MMDRLKLTNTILAINSIHITKEESCFWCELSIYAKEGGWNFVQLGSRKVPPVPGGSTLSIPALVRDLSPMRQHFPPEASLAPACWLEEDRVELMEEWERRCRMLPKEDDGVRENLRVLSHWVDTALTTLRPAALIQGNKLDHVPTLFWLGGGVYGQRRMLQERSPCDGMWIEPCGYFGESAIWSRYPGADYPFPPEYLAAGGLALANLAGNPCGFRNGEGRNEPLATLSLGSRPIVLVLMDNVVFTGWELANHPDRKLDYPLYRTPDAGVAHVHQIVTEMGGTVVLKKHPACQAFTPSRVPKGVLFHDGPLPEMLKSADVVVTFLTKTAYPALALGKPVVTLAKNPVAASGCTYYADTLEEVPAVLKAAIRREGLAERLGKLRPFLGWLAKDFLYSYSSQPPLLPHLAEGTMRCACVKGPKAVFELLVERLEFAERVSSHEVEEELRRLASLANLKPHAVRKVNETGLLKQRIEFLVRSYDHIALYGAGKLLYRLLDAGLPLDLSRTAVFDDSPDDKRTSVCNIRHSREMAGFLATGKCAVVMLTDTWQSLMRQRLEQLCPPEVEVIDLFTHPAGNTPTQQSKGGQT